MKYPKTPHLPGSKNNPDDIWVNMDNLNQNIDYIATEKMDGSNIMMNNKKFITRKGSVSTADWTYPARNLHYNVMNKIPNGIWITGELLTWRKCIAYENLPAEYIMFGAIKDNTCLAWDEVEELSKITGIPLVKTITNKNSMKNVIEEAKTKLSENMEGFVIRPYNSFPLSKFNENVAKYVGSWHYPVATSNGKNTFV